MMVKKGWFRKSSAIQGLFPKRKRLHPNSIVQLLNDTAGLFGLRRTSDLLGIDNQIISGSSLGSIRRDAVHPKAIRRSWFQIDGFSFHQSSFWHQCYAGGWRPVLFESLVFQLVFVSNRDRFELHRDGRLQERKKQHREKNGHTVCPSKQHDRNTSGDVAYLWYYLATKWSLHFFYKVNQFRNILFLLPRWTCITTALSMERMNLPTIQKHTSVASINSGFGPGMGILATLLLLHCSDWAWYYFERPQQEYLIPCDL